MAVFNVVEELVKLRTKEMFEKETEMCTCERCFEDVVAVACNNLPPKYIATPTGEVFEKIKYAKLQKTIDVNTAVYKAMKQVRDEPHHQ